MQVRLVVLLFWSGPILHLFQRTCACIGAGQIDDILSDVGPRRIECFRLNLQGGISDLDASGVLPYNATDRFSAAAGYGRGPSSGYKFLLGALLPLHNSSRTSDASTCTGIRRQLMVELVEALKLAVDEALEHSEVARELLSGLEIRDSCGMSQAAAEGATALSRLAVGTEATCHMVRGAQFNEAVSTRCDEGRQVTQVDSERVYSVIGPASSTEVDVVSPIFNNNKLPHFSFWSTSDRFNRKLDYPFLFRTTTSDAYQAWAMVDILKYFKWSYVYMLQGVQGSYRATLADSVRKCTLSRIGSKHNICFAQDEGFEFNDRPKINSIIRQWYTAGTATTQHKAPSVILLLAGYRYVDAILDAMEEMAIADGDFRRWMAAEHFVWIASDAWISAAVDVIHNTRRSVAMGYHTVIGTTFQVPDVISGAAGFEDRLLQRLLKVYPDKEHVHSNPWLGLVWQDTFNCRLPFLNCSGAGCGGRKPCDASVSVAEAFDMEAGNFSLPITSGSLWLAVQSSVWLLEEIVELSDGPVENLHERFAESLAMAMRQAAWDCRASHSSPPDTCGIFREQDLTHDIRVQAVQRTSDGGWQLKDLGTWVVPKDRNLTCQSHRNESDTNLFWTEAPSAALWANGQSHVPVSVCQTECPIGSIRLDTGNSRSGGIDRPRKCCWLCVPCGDSEYHNVGINACTACSAGSTPFRNKTGCVNLPDYYLGYASTAGVAILIPSAAMFVAAVLFAVLFVSRRRQLVVRLAGLELSILLLVGIAGGSLANAFLLARPSAQTCKFDNTLAAANIVFSLIVLVWRCLRHIAMSTRKGMPEWICRLAFALASNAVRQVLLVVVTQTVISLVFIIYGLYFPITPTSQNSLEKERRDLYCLHEPTTSIGLVFFVVLLLAFIALAFVGRKALIARRLGMAMVPNEATLLGLTAFLLTVFWSVALAIATLSKGIYLPVVTSVTILLHHFAILACLVLPRVRMLLQNKKTPKQISQHDLRAVRGTSLRGKQPSNIKLPKEIRPLTLTPPPISDESPQYHKGASPIATLTPDYLSAHGRTDVSVYCYEL